ncbi:MAG: glycosyltransferase family 4 protein [Gaiella sp.]
MRVALSMLTLIPGISGGSETYARALATELATGGRHEYEALLPAIAPDAAGPLPGRVVPEYRASATTAGRLRAMAAAAAFPGRLGGYLSGADVVHYPLTVPLPRTRLPVVQTLLDVQHLDLPQLFPRAERVFRALAYNRAARLAGQVIVISEWVRQRTIERLGLDPSRVHAVHLAVDHGLFTPAPGTPREAFLVYPARPWPHKNHARLFQAFASLRRSRPELRLVLTGAGHPHEGLPEGVEVRRGLSAEELVETYRRAACLVFPSLYEGFGLPPIEAMACGCPVAASSAGSLPEVCGDAAVLFDPFDPESIARGVEQALARAPELQARGLERAAAFTWRSCAEAHDRIYELAAS